MPNFERASFALTCTWSRRDEQLRRGRWPRRGCRTRTWWQTTITTRRCWFQMRSRCPTRMGRNQKHEVRQAALAQCAARGRGCALRLRLRGGPGLRALGQGRCVCAAKWAARRLAVGMGRTHARPCAMRCADLAWHGRAGGVGQDSNQESIEFGDEDESHDNSSPVKRPGQKVSTLRPPRTHTSPGPFAFCLRIGRAAPSWRPAFARDGCAVLFRGCIHCSEKDAADAHEQRAIAGASRSWRTSSTTRP